MPFWLKSSCLEPGAQAPLLWRDSKARIRAATDAQADAPTDQPCAHEMPGAGEAQSMQFKN